MRDVEFTLLDPVADLVNDTFEGLEKQGAFDEILRRLRTVISELPDGYSVSFDIQLNILDASRQQSLSLLTTGFNTLKGKEPYRHYGDTAPQKYLVDGEMCIVPDNFCPHCWGEWGFKFQNPVCPQCGYELGKQVKYLLDNDQCPYCQKGTVSVDRPKCSACGFEVDGKTIAWG